MAGNDNYQDDLLPLLIQGDVKAFNAIYDAYAPRLYRLAYNRIGIKEDCKEIVQDVFLMLWDKRESMHHVSSLYAYLHRAVKNKVFRYFSYNAVRSNYAEHYKVSERGWINSSEELQNLADTQAVINTTLSTLPEKVQKVFRMSREQHVPIRDIAQQMNLSTGTVENYIGTALKHLRTSLDKSMLLVFWYYL